MAWFGILKGLVGLAILITRRMERKGLMRAGAAESELKMLKEAHVRIHNAHEAWVTTNLADDSLYNDRDKDS